ncbi:disease resistance protein RGA2-like [Silene latifolia]|uniref:disease resistance protein RGA2-like n=1 Tax=Silene latifolia TaxID=37657 RepID=UPI003D77AF8B
MGDLGTVLSAAQVLFAAVDSSSLKEACSIFRYKSNLEDLKRTIISIKSLLIDAGQRIKLSEFEENYIKTLDKAVYDADDLFDKFRTVAERNQLLKHRKFSVKVHKFFSSQNQVKVALQIYHGVKKVRNNLIATADDHTRFGFRVDVQPLRRTREDTHSSFYAHDIVGREDETAEIVSKLLDSNEDVAFLTIVRVGGLPGIHGLQAIMYTCGFTQCVPKVLDDIWNENALKWNKLKKILMISGKGSRILVTTRSDITARIIGNGTHNTHYLKGLSDENSWRLFKMNAFECGAPIYVDIGKRIVAKCSNLPLAIKVVGSLLCGHTIDKWHAIETNGLAGISNGKNELMSILKFSYDNLEPCSKSCFAYCSIFPKNFVINKELLMNLWDAQGYILPFDEGQSIESAREEQFVILLRRCFFYDVKKNEYGDVVSFKIHDLMHDIAQSVTKNEIHVIINSNIISNEENNNNNNNNARHIFETRDNITDDFFTKSRTRSYLRFREYNFHDVEPFPVGEMVKKWTYLRALALNRICVEVLPDSIGSSKVIFFPALEFLEIESLLKLKGWSRSWAADAFPRLSQLIIKNCPDLASFPPCSILRTLYLQGNNEALRIRTTQIIPSSSSSCYDKILDLTVEVDSVAYLKSLLVPQKPTNLIISNDHSLEKLSDVEELFRSCSSSLHTLNVEFCSKLTSLHGGLEHLVSLHSLTLGYCGELKLDDDDNGGRCIPWRPLQNLRSLSLKCLDKLEVLPYGMHYLTRLKHLHIYGCDKLSVLPEWVSCFQSLQSLRIESCRALKFLPQAMSKLKSLQELKIFQCPDLKQICQRPNGEDWPKIQHIPQIYI